MFGHRHYSQNCALSSESEHLVAVFLVARDYCVRVYRVFDSVCVCGFFPVAQPSLSHLRRSHVEIHGKHERLGGIAPRVFHNERADRDRDRQRLKSTTTTTTVATTTTTFVRRCSPGNVSFETESHAIGTRRPLRRMPMSNANDNDDDDDCENGRTTNGV